MTSAQSAVSKIARIGLRGVGRGRRAEEVVEDLLEGRAVPCIAAQKRLHQRAGELVGRRG